MLQIITDDMKSAWKEAAATAKIANPRIEAIENAARQALYPYHHAEAPSDPAELNLYWRILADMRGAELQRQHDEVIEATQEYAKKREKRNPEDVTLDIFFAANIYSPFDFLLDKYKNPHKGKQKIQPDYDAIAKMIPLADEAAKKGSGGPRNQRTMIIAFLIDYCCKNEVRGLSHLTGSADRKQLFKTFIGYWQALRCAGLVDIDPVTKETRQRRPQKA